MKRKCFLKICFLEKIIKKFSLRIYMHISNKQWVEKMRIYHLSLKVDQPTFYWFNLKERAYTLNVYFGIKKHKKFKILLTNTTTSMKAKLVRPFTISLYSSIRRSSRNWGRTKYKKTLKFALNLISLIIA